MARNVACRAASRPFRHSSRSRIRSSGSSCLLDTSPPREKLASGHIKREYTAAPTARLVFCSADRYPFQVAQQKSPNTTMGDDSHVSLSGTQPDDVVHGT